MLHQVEVPKWAVILTFWFEMWGYIEHELEMAVLKESTKTTKTKSVKLMVKCILEAIVQGMSQT